MSIEKRLTIVARYNEDISWTESLTGDVAIYNKGETFPYDLPRVDVKNIGREAETYVRAIIDFYDKLEQFDSVCFLQGNPFDHCKNIMDILSKHMFLYFYERQETYQPIIYLADESFRVYCPKDFFIFGSHTNIVDLYWSEIDKKSYKHITDNKVAYQIENVKFDMFDMLYLLEIMKIPYEGKPVTWAYGAMYLVETKLILCKSKEWWSNFYNFINYTLEVLESPSIPFVLERLWSTIFLYGYNNG
jgi:hypothetical protein